MAQVFVSYDRADRHLTDRFIPLIRRVYGNDSVWFDDDIRGGADWWQMILTEIGQCDLFVYLISDDSLESEYCQAEMREAVRLKKQILPVIVRQFNPPYPGNIELELAEILRRTQYVDMSSGLDDTDAVVALYAAITPLLTVSRVNAPGHDEAVLTQWSELSDFVSAARIRWNTLIAPLHADDVARMLHGHFEIAFSIVGIERPPTIRDLRLRIEEASRISHSGWPPFMHLDQPAFEPHPVEGALETWLGDPAGERRSGRDPMTCDFWRAHPTGDFFLLRGYIEDSSNKVEPGKIIDPRLPIKQVGEILLFASRLAKLLGDDLEILIQCHYVGLKNRWLMSLNSPLGFLDGRICYNETASLETQATVLEIEQNLVEILHTLLYPLYEQFSLFELDPDTIAREIADLKKSQFPHI